MAQFVRARTRVRRGPEVDRPVPLLRGFGAEEQAVPRRTLPADDPQRRREGGGVLRDDAPIDKRLQTAVAARVKVMATLDIAEKRMPQDGSFVVYIGGAPVDVRVAVLPTKHGEQVVLRLLQREQNLELPDDPLLANGDRRRLQRVLLNLLRNAIVYAPSTERIALRLTRLNGEAQIEVEDTGPGIPAEALPHVFDRFYRGEHATGSQGGLGLGLSIAREIIAAHDGTIVARSTAGEGTTIEIRLPLLTAP